MIALLNGSVLELSGVSLNSIQEQLAAVQSDISATELVEKMVSYAKAKIAYFNALRAEIPEMTDIVTGRQPRPSDLDKFPAAFSVAGEKQEKAADEETLILLQRFSGNADVQKARAEFGRAQAHLSQFLAHKRGR